MVSIIVRAYNVSTTIRQTLESILCQETIYDYEVIVGINPGEDNTLEICREYKQKFSNIRILAHSTNIGPIRNWIECVQTASGKYIMMCDGDDYWHNPKKIQFQVDYMETHPKCVLLHTDYNQLNNQSGKIKINSAQFSGKKNLEGEIQKEIFEGKVSIANVTSCYRRDVFNAHVPINKYIELGLLGDDYPTWVILSAYGDVCYLPISTATYRVGQMSITSEVNYNRIKQRYEAEKRQAKWLMEMFPNLGAYSETDEKFYDNYCTHQLLLAAYRANDYKNARKFGKQDKMPNWKTKMARTWLTFQIAQLAIRMKR